MHLRSSGGVAVTLDLWTTTDRRSLITTPRQSDQSTWPAASHKEPRQISIPRQSRWGGEGVGTLLMSPGPGGLESLDRTDTVRLFEHADESKHRCANRRPVRGELGNRDLRNRTDHHGLGEGTLERLAEPLREGGETA